MSPSSNWKTAATVNTYSLSRLKRLKECTFCQSSHFYASISISIYFCLCLFSSLSLLLLSSKVQPVKQVYRERDALDKLFIVSYSYVIFLLGGKWLGCSHKLSIYIGSTERSVLAVCLWPGVAGVE